MEINIEGLGNKNQVIFDTKSASYDKKNEEQKGIFLIYFGLF